MCNGLGTYRPPDNPMNGILCPTCQGKKTERKPNMLEFKLIPGDLFISGFVYSTNILKVFEMDLERN